MKAALTHCMSQFFATVLDRARTEGSQMSHLQRELLTFDNVLASPESRVCTDTQSTTKGNEHALEARRSKEMTCHSSLVSDNSPQSCCYTNIDACDASYCI